MNPHKRFFRQGSAARVALPCFLFLLLVGAGCGNRREYAFQGLALGTTYTVKVTSASRYSDSQQQAMRDAIASELEFVDSRMSTYREESELSRFNRYTGSESFEMSPETREVIRRALQISRDTEGAFDITVGPLVNAWGFGAEDRSSEDPDEATLAVIRERVGYTKVILDATGVRKTHPDVYCDLSAIAKGYAVDRVANALDTMGVQDYMVEVGGEISAKGYNSRGTGWKIGIETPDPAERAFLRVFELKDRAMATSGDYRNFHERDSGLVSHLIDPRTGVPIAHGLASVTVLHDDCTTADAYATAFIVLGPQKGFALAERLGLAALFITRDGKDGYNQKTTSAFEALESDG